MKTLLSEKEMSEIVVGEAISMATILAIVVIAVAAVIVYKLFTSSKGSTQLPGGYKFEWK